MILLGIMEFGRAYNVQTTLTNAARESVRSMAINNSQTTARTAAKNAATQLNPALADGNITFSATDCTVGLTDDGHRQLQPQHIDRHRRPVCYDRERNHAVRRLSSFF
jgi:hypothetical protein